jgi:uncharacterized protein (DUF305 family)
MPSSPLRPARHGATLVVAAAVVAAAGMLTGCGEAATGSGAATATTARDPKAAAEQDAAFATAMIEHHHQTLQLVGLAAEHAESPAILTYTGELQVVHDAQILTLTALLTGWGRPVPHIEGHTELGDSIPGVLDAAQLSALRASPPAEFERTFLATLRTHQERAIALARTEIERGGDARARALAEQIRTATAGQLETLGTLGTA